MQHRQRQKYAAQAAQAQPQYAPPAPPTPAGEADYAAELQTLAELKAAGILTEEEFEAKKKQILGI